MLIVRAAVIGVGSPAMRSLGAGLIGAVVGVLVAVHRVGAVCSSRHGGRHSVRGCMGGGAFYGHSVASQPAQG